MATKRYTVKVMPTVTIEDEGGVLAVYIDWHFGCGPEFCASFATGIHAAYPEARERQRAEAQRNAEEYKHEILALYPTGYYAPEGTQT